MLAGSGAEAERHLLAELVDVAYRDLSDHARATAQRQLRRLARLMAGHGRQRLEWWTLAGLLPRWPTRLLTVLCIVVFTGAWMSGEAAALGTGSAVGSAVPLAVFIALGMALVAGDAGSPSAVRPRLRPSLPTFLRALRPPLQRGAVLGVALAVWTVLVHGPAATGWLAFGVGLGLMFGGPLALVEAFTAPVGIERAVTPRGSARADRTWSLARGLVFGLTVGATLPVALKLVLDRIGRAGDPGFVSDIPRWTPGELVASAVYLCVPAAFGFLLVRTAWGQYGLATAYLAATRHAPWRLLRFLEQARTRGVLRQDGAAYLFRHQRLRDHLADQAAGPPGPTSATAARSGS